MDYSRARPLGSSGRMAPERAFVLQLNHAPAGKAVSGRVESVATGEHAQFETLQELEAFLKRSRSCEG